MFELNKWRDWSRIGTFGQPDTWDIHDSDTFQHPMVPYDVLIDPRSLPIHPVIKERENVRDILYGEDGGESATDDSDSEKVFVCVQYCVVQSSA